ncbi:TPA: hypothetical protein ACUA84_005104, partial [Escherichia coli]
SRYNRLYIVSSDYASIVFFSGDFHHHMSVVYARESIKISPCKHLKADYGDILELFTKLFQTYQELFLDLFIIK